MAMSFPIVAAALAHVERETGVSRVDLGVPRRTPDRVRARAILVCLVKEHSPDALLYPRIGRMLGDRNHPESLRLHKYNAARLLERDLAFVAACERFAGIVDRRRALA